MSELRSTPLSSKHAGAAVSHVVRSGENLDGIAHRFHCDPRTLARANGIADPRRLRPGTRLQIPRRRVDSPSDDRAELSNTEHSAPDKPPTSGVTSLGQRLGDLSMKYETNCSPWEWIRAIATVSDPTRTHDPGGASYGAWQFASQRITLRRFLQLDGVRWQSRFLGHDPREVGGSFGAAWAAVATEEPFAFFQCQHAFTMANIFRPATLQIARRSNVAIRKMSLALQDVVWSFSVQHGNSLAARLIGDAIAHVGSHNSRPQTSWEHDIINACYDIREDFVRKTGNQRMIGGRYEAERSDALQELVICSRQ